ncbi:hypothetical protein ACFSUD_08480 [Sulfitobacter aestuarii]|uniref:Uncharacterized protein n=1 Tax=Sulfitobacter aestuarii TaxID=2161676 RepID=A0ABW5U356_9RHOB
MLTFDRAVLRQQYPLACRIAQSGRRLLRRAALTLAFLALPIAAQAQTYPQSRPHIVKNDRGGLLLKRLAEIRNLRRTGQPVRITGSVCYSTCTMLIGLPQTCISADTTFGFHGPSSFGRPLDPHTFNRASAVISEHYPAPLRSWYMSKARYNLRSLSYVSGREMIRLGVRAC